MKTLIQNISRKSSVDRTEWLGRVHSALSLKPVQTSQIIAGMLGLSVPIIVGGLTGQVKTGIVASIGGLALSGSGKGMSFREQTFALVYALVAGSAAMLTGSVLSGDSIAIAVGIPGFTAVAALLGSISIQMVRATTIYILFTIIATDLGVSGAHPVVVTVMFSLGAAWTAVLTLILRSLFANLGSISPLDSSDMVQRPKYTMRQKLRRWKKSLKYPAGWQYVMRITSCMVAAEIYEWLWPGHHGNWVYITVAIVVQRNMKSALSRTYQRAVGTVFGVLLSGFLLIGTAPFWLIIGMIAILTAARSFFMDINYVAYTTAITPLIILLLDFGQDSSWTVITDRLVATLFGCMLALTLGYLLWRWIPAPAYTAVRYRRESTVDVL